MRISDWIADVCSSDLLHIFDLAARFEFHAKAFADLGEAAPAAVGGVEDRPVRGRGLGHHRCAGLVGVCLERRGEFGGSAAPEEMRVLEVDGPGPASHPAFEVGAFTSAYFVIWSEGVI